MDIKANVPLFNEDVSADDPAEAGKSFVGMALGVIFALGALAVGTWGFDRINQAAGTDAEAGIPVAGE